VRRFVKKINGDKGCEDEKNGEEDRNIWHMIQDSRFRIQDSRFSPAVGGAGIQDSGYWSLVTDHWLTG